MELTKEIGKTCCKKVIDKQYYHTESWICNAPAMYKHGQHYFCRHHSKLQRYVIRVGDIGEILARFDTEGEIRKQFPSFSGINLQMQKLTKSRKRQLY